MNMNRTVSDRFNPALKAVLFLMRTAIGWHFLVEGIAKLYTPGWTSSGYLEISRWILKDGFHWITAHPAVLHVVDWMNMLGLTAIGLGLILGVFVRTASIAGAVLLALYYAANPPLLGMDFGAVTEGNYLVIDKNAVEFFALCVLVFLPKGFLAGLENLRLLSRKARRDSAEKPSGRGSLPVPESQSRRDWIRNFAGLPFLGALGFAVAGKRAWESYEERNLADATTSATIRTFNFSGLKELKTKVPSTRIGNLEVSRLILGGNLIGGWAHSRDLVYVSSLVKKYHSRDKVFETLLLAEKCGVNTLITNPSLCHVIEDYWRRDIGKIQFISDLGYFENASGLVESAQKSVDRGAKACYIHGGSADWYQSKGRIAELGDVIEAIRGMGVPAGIGAHSLDTVRDCVREGIFPDFWMKTLHHHRYWSARIRERNDSVFCETPERVIEFMRKRPEPWIAFKILAAGAIPPADGFEFAFRNGADLICVGMYDFQIVEDVNAALNAFASVCKEGREREWRA
jgi:uncharacterized membrane protein YphA (DoxX/SURF4 family)